MVAGFVTALLIALAGYIYWASPTVGKRSRSYDIFFEKSVAGLFENSSVSLQGVAVGKVGRIRFDRYDPEHVQVRIHITNPDAPILEGTTASIDRDLFGTALISLDAGPAGSPPIRSARWNKVPVIPAKEGGLSLEDPVSIVENISNTADKLNRFLTPANQRSISDQIARMERRSRELAARTPTGRNDRQHTKLAAVGCRDGRGDGQTARGHGQETAGQSWFDRGISRLASFGS